MAERYISSKRGKIIGLSNIDQKFLSIPNTINGIDICGLDLQGKNNTFTQVEIPNNKQFIFYPSNFKNENSYTDLKLLSTRAETINLSDSSQINSENIQDSTNTETQNIVTISEPAAAGTEDNSTITKPVLEDKVIFYDNSFYNNPLSLLEKYNLDNIYVKKGGLNHTHITSLDLNNKYIFDNKIYYGEGLVNTPKLKNIIVNKSNNIYSSTQDYTDMNASTKYGDYILVRDNNTNVGISLFSGELIKGITNKNNDTGILRLSELNNLLNNDNKLNLYPYCFTSGSSYISQLVIDSDKFNFNNNCFNLIEKNLSSVTIETNINNQTITILPFKEGNIENLTINSESFDYYNIFKNVIFNKVNIAFLKKPSSTVGGSGGATLENILFRRLGDNAEVYINNSAGIEDTIILTKDYSKINLININLTKEINKGTNITKETDRIPFFFLANTEVKNINFVGVKLFYYDSNDSIKYIDFNYGNYSGGENISIELQNLKHIDVVNNIMKYKIKKLTIKKNLLENEQEIDLSTKEINNKIQINSSPLLTLDLSNIAYKTIEELDIRTTNGFYDINNATYKNSFNFAHNITNLRKFYLNINDINKYSLPNNLFINNNYILDVYWDCTEDNLNNIRTYIINNGNKKFFPNGSLVHLLINGREQETVVYNIPVLDLNNFKDENGQILYNSLEGYTIKDIELADRQNGPILNTLEGGIKNAV